jgi:hypothetical protein
MTWDGPEVPILAYPALQDFNRNRRRETRPAGKVSRYVRAVIYVHSASESSSTSTVGISKYPFNIQKARSGLSTCGCTFPILASRVAGKIKTFKCFANFQGCCSRWPPPRAAFAWSATRNEMPNSLVQSTDLDGLDLSRLCCATPASATLYRYGSWSKPKPSVLPPTEMPGLLAGRSSCR